MLAAFDPDSLLKLVVLVLLGSGGLVKSFLERKRAREAGGGESVSRRRRAETQRRLAELEGGERGVPAEDPWQILLEGGDPRTAAGRAAVEEDLLEEELLEEELVSEPFFVEEPVVSASAATPEVSIARRALGESSVDWDSFDEGKALTELGDPGARIRASVFEDLGSSLPSDIAEHVSADMAEGLRGEAVIVEAIIERKAHARRGWRGAVLAAEVLGPPLALRDLARQPSGLWNS